MWYLARTKYGNELTAQVNLKAQGFESYFPLAQLERIRKGRLEIVEEPAFRGYIFISFDPITQSAYHINNTKGVSQLVVFDGQIASIPNHIIENIKKTFQDFKHSDRYQKDQQVKIISGPFKDFDAIFMGHDGETHCYVAITLLNRRELIKIDLKMVAL